MKVYVAFNIEKDGRLTDIRIMRGCPVDCINEAVLKVVKEMPKFNPGIRKGDPVKVKQVILPVSLKL